MEEKAIFIFHWTARNETFDIETPMKITANEFITALNKGLVLGINTNDISQLYLKATNPIALIKGNRTLSEYGLHNGTEIWFDR